MKLLIGKWHFALRFKNDLCIGIGRPSNGLRAEADRSRPHLGI